MATAEAKGGGAPSPRLPPGEEKLNEERFLQEAFKAVKQHAFYMKRALVRPPRRVFHAPHAPPLRRTRTTCARR